MIHLFYCHSRILIVDFSKEALRVQLKFLGLLKKDGSKKKKGALKFHYKFTIEGGLKFGELTDDLYAVVEAEGIFGGPVNAESINFYLKAMKTVYIDSNGRLWPRGNLKITFEMTFPSHPIHHAVNVGVLSTMMSEIKQNCSLGHRLFNSEDLSDVKIICEGSTFYAHKLILSGTSRSKT